ncbi:unnamed protein product [Cylindrotheca closterium]|uniref:Glycosyltransferase 2-like domain-containing protein n=1 Tax=Cylindrotheca closterium TaxID=2856 RepID=A0AAD2FS32_9STRA|nr:unnamed protein product [Cylindrotheca closterium]
MTKLRSAILSLWLLNHIVLGSCAIDDSPTSRQLDDENSASSRRMSSLGSKMTTPMDPLIRRLNYPENQPHICLAFLSCCGRTDLLNATIAGAIRHMEEDEPYFLRFEIAWVDNGSGKEATSSISNSYQIENALILPSNSGLAYGMNLLINNLCKAPYILLLEEDWLYLDEVVAKQTEERKRSVATSIALLESMEKNEISAFDGRRVSGVFLREETYTSFLQWPHENLWETAHSINIEHELKRMGAEEPSCDKGSSAESNMVADIDYRIYCSDPSLQKSHIWGSYTNGAGLYKRSSLKHIGRMYGEPGDAFHDRYTEGNYAYRAGLKFCHASIRLTKDVSCDSISNVDCTGAFHHIGGGRGTRPMTAHGSVCEDFGWNFYRTPMYSRYHKFVEASTGTAVQMCSREELKQLQDRKFRDKDSESYRRQVKESNAEVFQREQKQRDNMRREARLVLQYVDAGRSDALRTQVSWMAGKSEESIRIMATRMIKLADSPHPLTGFWDSHGRIVSNQDTEQHERTKR